MRELLCSPAILWPGASQQRSRKARRRAGVSVVERDSGPDCLVDGVGDQGGRVARHVRHVGDLEGKLELCAVLLLLCLLAAEEEEVEEEEKEVVQHNKDQLRSRRMPTRTLLLPWRQCSAARAKIFLEVP